MIGTVHSRIWNNATDEASPVPPDTDVVFESTGQASFCTMTRTPLPTQPISYDHDYDWDTQPNVDLMIVPIELLRFLGNEFGNRVRFCTEYRQDIYTFRCHPCYQSDGPIFDWMLVRFEGYDDKFPCWLAAVVINDSFDILDINAKRYNLVVQCTTKRLAHKSSVLLIEWTWLPQYYVIDTNDIVAPCFVISVVADHSVVLETKARHFLWPEQFTSIFK